MFTVKGATTAEFRKLWGLQDEYSNKDRSNNAHHCIDAIVIACIGRREYQEWAEYKSAEEFYKWNRGKKPVFRKPWATFTQDVKAIANELLVYNYTADNMPRRTKKICKHLPLHLRDDKHKQYYSQGDSVRGSINKATFYGAIKKDNQIKYVIRKRLSELKESEIDKIVDDVVKAKVGKAVKERGFSNLCSAPVWMNEEKGIEIKKVRIYLSISNPISLKKHRDASIYEHKQNYYVEDDGNYCICIYEGKNNKGKIDRSIRIENNLDAAKRFKNKDPEQRKISKIDENGYNLKYVLKKGSLVLFYENSPEELYNCSEAELSKRLYKVIGLEKDGRVEVLNVKESKGPKERKGGTWCNDGVYRAEIRISKNNFYALIEGVHFKMSESGKITFFNI